MIQRKKQHTPKFGFQSHVAPLSFFNMAPIQVILLLVLVRLPSTLGEGGGQQHGYVLSQLPTLIMAMFVSHFLLLSYVAMRARATIRQLHLTTTSAAAVANRFERLLPAARWATILFTACHLFFPASHHGGALPAHLTAFLQTTNILKHIPLLPECLYIAPAMLTWLGFWTIQYFVETAYRERTMPYRLATAQPAHEMPAIGQYLSMQMRHNFYLVVPVVGLTLIEYVADLAKPRFPNAPFVAVGAAILLFLLMIPWLITRIWNTVPLAGPLRTRLDSLAAEYRLRFKNILVWKTHNAVSNAAILGYLPFSRYFLMTDALLESLTDRQLEAVFAHEVGHGYHRHLWWYLVSLFSAIMLTTSAADLITPHLPTRILQTFGSADNAALMLSLVLLAWFLTLCFPFVSHRFEHQADHFAAKHMAKQPDSIPLPAAMLVTPSPETIGFTVGPMTTAAPPSGAEIFISALDTITDLSHRSRNQRGWMHPSINQRVALLRELESSPVAQQRFARQQRRTRLYIILFAAAAVALTTYATLRPVPTLTTPQPEMEVDPG
ncbi:MAG: M48 family metallopeptidase [Phycisphaerales bacterium]|nr:M48 family metallopeptidase [Phycisphaerales bacterium]